MPEALSMKICSQPAAVKASCRGVGGCVAGGDRSAADPHGAVGRSLGWGFVAEALIRWSCRSMGVDVESRGRCGVVAQ